MIAVAVAALAVGLTAAGVVIVTAKPAVPHARNPIVTIKDPPGSKGASAGAFSPDGTTLAVGDGNGNVYLWNLARPSKPVILIGPGFDAFATPVVFSPDGAMVVNFNGATRVWRVG
jgi:WD40 repeat protein